MPMLTVSLPPRLAANVRAAIEEGDYASESEVLREALDLWCARRRRRVSGPEFSSRERRDGDGVCVADLLSAHRAKQEALTPAKP